MEGGVVKGTRVLVIWHRTIGDWRIAVRVVENCDTRERWIESALDDPEFAEKGLLWEREPGGQAVADRELKRRLTPAEVQALKIKFQEAA
jgi:hypothetical protein